MKTHQYTIMVSADDIDALHHVNNVRYVQWVQDAAEAHWKSLATDTMKKQYLWVVLSHHIEYKGQAFLGDKVLVKTFVSRSKGVTSTRVVEMYHEEKGHLLVKAETNWCLLDAQSKRPTRMNDELISLFE
ncbi:acyl-CoA thioesterase [Robertkochia sediminum]|uniref:acyl-CoA thioesterase n=1 Tax=Robertkochia sediminum TaxID=2785326 RepID=UPI0019341A1E|nr:acyl-CoA thioesterase [Robertkochia sediminum]